MEKLNDLEKYGMTKLVPFFYVAFFNRKNGWLIWSFIHLISITGFKNKFAVSINWMLKYLSYEKANQLIIRKYSRD